MTFEKLGTIDTSWLEFGEEIGQNLLDMMEIEQKNDSTVYVQFSADIIRYSAWSHWDGVAFSLYPTDARFDWLTFDKGVEVALPEGKQSIYLVLDFKNYENPKYCRSTFKDEWLLPLRLKR